MSLEITRKKRKSREEWAQHIEKWRTSGMTQTEYCSRHSLCACSFSTWKRKFEEENDAIPFVEIGNSNSLRYEGEGQIELIFEHICLRFREEIDPIKLRNIVLALIGV